MGADFGTLTTLAKPHEKHEKTDYCLSLVACGDYIENRIPNSPQRTRFNDLVIQWTWGFQAAHNWYSGERQIKEGLEQNTVLVYLDKECRDQPQTVIVYHISKLVKQLSTASH
jgi:hypothetical protein